MKTTLERSSSDQGMSRREFVASAVAAFTTAVAATLPAALPVSASAQVTPRLDSGAITLWSLVKVDKRTPQLWQVTIANPPFNLVVPEMVSALHSIVKEMDRDPAIKVIVFSSGIEGYFRSHAICAMRVARKRCSASPRSAQASCLAGAEAKGCRGSSGEIAHWRSS